MNKSHQFVVCDWLQRLQAKVLKLVDISYGGENGFNQAIELSAEVLSNVKFIQEKKLIGKILILTDAILYQMNLDSEIILKCFKWYKESLNYPFKRS